MTAKEELKPQILKKINDQAFLASLEQRNAMYRGLFASKKFAANRHELPSPPNSVTTTEKLFWFTGVHVGMDQFDEQDTFEPDR